MSKKSVSLGQVLLGRVKCFDGRSADELDKLDCSLIECARSDGATRPVHRCVIEVGSDFFANEISKLRLSDATPSGTSPNAILLDASIDVVDIILEYLYTREPIQITLDTAIEAYAAGQRFGLSEIENQVKKFLQTNIDHCLADERFLDVSNSPVDIALLVEVFEGRHLEVGTKFKLMQRIETWCSSDAGKSKTTWKLCQKLLSAPNTRTIPRTPPVGQGIAVAVVGHRGLKNSDEEDRMVVAVPSLSVIWHRRYSKGSPVYYSPSVISNGQIYLKHFDKICVCNLSSNEEIRELSSLNEDSIRGLRVFADEVFFYTDNEIYVIDSLALGGDCSKVASVDEDLNSSLTILKRDANEFTVATQSQLKMEVRAFTFRAGHAVAVSSVKLQTLPPNMWLIGSHDGVLYFRTASGSPYHYVGFRDEMEIKRCPIDNCYTLIDCYICNGLLYLVYFAEDNKKMRYACGIDLHSDDVIFKKSCDELGLQEIYWIVPVVGWPSSA